MRTELKVKTFSTSGEMFVRLQDYKELETENLELKARLKKYESEDLKKHGKENRR